MRKGRLSIRLGVTACLPLLFAVAVLPSHLTSFVCRFTGAVMESEACCPEMKGTPSGDQARLRDEACCAISSLVLPTLVSERRSEAQHQQLDQVGDVSAAEIIPPPSGGRAPIRYVVPPLRPPPIALKRSLLI
jgi:hypothetical protein